MKTSSTQFEMLVNYMEQNGDLSKPCKTPGGRVLNIKKWEELANLLNSDPTGESKVTEKWKKVWSDLKNNTKKKAARINKAASGTGGGPALKTKLTELEEKVLSIIGSQAATGFTNVVEAGFPEDQEQDPDRTATLTPTPPPPIDSPEIINMQQADQELWNLPGPSWQESTHQSTPIPPRAESASIIHPRQDVCVTPVPEPERPTALHSRTPQRRHGLSTRRIAGSPRRPRRTQTHVDRASEHFLHSDEQWRRFLIKKHEDECRIKEMELQTQQRWQDIATVAVDAFHKIVNKFCKD